MTTSQYRSTKNAHSAGAETWVRLTGELTEPAVAAARAQLDKRRVRRLAVAVAKGSLDFIGELPELDDLTVVRTDYPDLQWLEPHAHSLRTLHLETGLDRVSLAPLRAMRVLEELYLRRGGRPLIREVPETLAALAGLKHLVLHSVTLKDLASLTGLPHLRGLALKQGGAPDLSALADLQALRFFEAYSVRGLEDLTPLFQAPRLEVVWLESQGRIVIPDLSAARALQHVRMWNVSLTAQSLRNIAAAPALRQLHASRQGPLFEPADADPLRGHPTLEAAWIPMRGRVGDEQMSLGLAGHIDVAPFVAFGAGVMGLPPDGWDGNYTLD